MSLADPSQSSAHRRRRRHSVARIVGIEGGAHRRIDEPGQRPRRVRRARSCGYARSSTTPPPSRLCRDACPQVCRRCNRVGRAQATLRPTWTRIGTHVGRAPPHTHMQGRRGNNPPAPCSSIVVRVVRAWSVARAGTRRYAIANDGTAGTENLVLFVCRRQSVRPDPWFVWLFCLPTSVAHKSQIENQSQSAPHVHMKPKDNTCKQLLLLLLLPTTIVPPYCSPMHRLVTLRRLATLGGRFN